MSKRRNRRLLKLMTMSLHNLIRHTLKIFIKTIIALLNSMTDSSTQLTLGFSMTELPSSTSASASRKPSIASIRSSSTPITLTDSVISIPMLLNKISLKRYIQKKLLLSSLTISEHLCKKIKRNHHCRRNNPNGFKLHRQTCKNNTNLLLFRNSITCSCKCITQTFNFRQLFLHSQLTLFLRVQ
ncbi:hypothetical protein V6Z11_D12G282100 [Gossypium hirsutum]